MIWGRTREQEAGQRLSHEGFGLRDFSLLRRGATMTIATAVAAVLAGCNAEYQGNLNAAAPQNNSSASPAAVASAAGPAAAPAGSPGPDVRIAAVAPPADAPMPVPRPDFGERTQLAAAGQPDGKPAAAPSQAPATPLAQVGAQQAAPPVQRPVRVASAQGQVNFFGLFSPAPGPSAPRVEEDPEPPLSPSEESLHKRSFNAYEDRIASAAEGGQNAALAPAVAPEVAASPIRTVTRTTAGGAVLATAYAPAVVEVNGVATPASASATPRQAIRPSLAPAARHAQPAGGGSWRAAYPNVVTHCFDSNLRSALETIGRHFNTEVEVTSGYRINGRRRSMHRFCRAADIRIPGVAPSTLARFARSLPGVNGVGTYRRKSIIHIDTRLQQMSWRY